MPQECRDMEPHDVALALLHSLEERGLIEIPRGSNLYSLSYHVWQWYGVDDPHKDVLPPGECECGGRVRFLSGANYRTSTCAL
jgi:hypothetical protein